MDLAADKFAQLDDRLVSIRSEGMDLSQINELLEKFKRE